MPDTAQDTPEQNSSTPASDSVSQSPDNQAQAEAEKDQPASGSQPAEQPQEQTPSDSPPADSSKTTSDSESKESSPQSTDQADLKTDKQPEIVGETEQLVVFQLAGELYAAPILDVQEIIPYTEVTPIPNVADYIEGIINVRGTVATIINLSKKFNLKNGSELNNQYIVLTRIKKSLLGMMVDEVTSVIKVPKSEIKSANAADSQIHTDYIKGVVVVNEKVILILDFSQILAKEEIDELSAEQPAQTNSSNPSI